MHPLGLIPEDWIKSARCPVCKASPLTVENALEADRLACARCGAAFEVEDGGTHVCIVRMPAVARAAPDGLWRTPAETRAWVRALALRAQALEPSLAQATTAPAPATPPAAPDAQSEALPQPPASPTSQSSLVNLDLFHAQARQLLKLNHTPPQIKVILERAGKLTAEHIASVMAEVEQLHAQKKAQERRTLRLIFSGAISLLALCGLISALANIRPGIASAGPLPTALSGDRPASTPTPLSLLDHLLQPVWGAPQEAATNAGSGVGSVIERSNLPAPLQTLLPPGVTVLEQPTPTIWQGDGPPASQCPRTPQEAAALFGGVPELWQIESATEGWMLFSNGEPVTVRVPANMTLGYLLVEPSLSMSMNNVSGPATVENVFFGAIICQ
jgi:hypothetical protein